MALDIRMARTEEDVRLLAHFLAEVIRDYPAYITSGEIKYARASGPDHWSDDLEEAIFSDLQEETGSGQAYAFGAWENGVLMGVFNLSIFSFRNRVSGIVDDFAVRKSARRRGIGGKMLKFIEDFFTRKGVQWVFLEIGTHNEASRAFFTRHGFEKLSCNYGKPLL